MKIWDVSIRQPVFITMMMIALIVLGLVSYLRMPVDLFPDVSFPIVAVTTVYPGANPEEVEAQVTSVLEEEFSSLAGLDTISSQSGEGFSLVIMQFTQETSSDQASQDVRERLNLVSNRLPNDTLDPVVQRFDPSDTPIMTFAVSDRTGSLTPAELRMKVEDEIQQPLQRIDGVAVVEVQGGDEREIQVNMDMLALQGKRVAPQQVVTAIQMSNLNIPGGSVPVEDSNVLVRTPGNFQSLEDLQNVVVSQRGAPVYVRDVATVVDGFVEQDTISRLNGKEAVVFTVRKQSGSNTIDIADKVNAELEDISAENPELDIANVIDQSTFVRESTGDAINDTIWGGILAFIVVLVFFRNFRNTTLTMIGLPIIMIGSLAGMYFLGISLNMVSLLALAIVVGLVIDDAIVVRENIFRWVGMGYTPKEAASKATAEVALPVLATSATILAVFLPVAFASGIVGQFFKDFGLTVAIAIIVSTVEALTLAPMISAYYFVADKKSVSTQTAVEESESDETATVGTHTLEARSTDDPQLDGEEVAGEGVMYRVYGRMLNWTLDHKKLTVVISLIVIIASLASFPFVDQTFIAELDQGEFTASLTLPPGTRLDITEEAAKQVENVMIAHPAVADVMTTVGGQGTPEQATFQVKVLDDSPVSTRSVIDDLRAELNDVDGLAFQLVSAMSFGVGGLSGRDVVVEVTSLSGNHEDLAAATAQVMAELAKIPGLADVETDLTTGKPEMRIDVDEQRAAQNGLSVAMVGGTLRTLLTGQVASTYRGEGPQADIRVQLDEKHRSSLDDVLNFKLLSQTGQLVPLRNVATASLGEGPTVISRSNRQPTALIGANRTGRAEAEVQADVNQVLATVSLPAGVEAKLSGQAAQQAEAFSDLFLTMALSIVFVYMVLASQFRSFTQPGLIMLSMPLAIIGAIVALIATDTPLDMTAMIGFIMLMGLATKNSILLVDFANQERERGATADEAMRKAGPVRLRPILMTALSLIIAMIPVALGLGPGGGFRAPLAIGVIGGMTTSTFLTLFIVPLAYAIWVGFQDRWALRGARKKAAKAKEATAAQPTTQQPQPIQSSS